jgi:hypothetical protein
MACVQSDSIDCHQLAHLTLDLCQNFCIGQLITLQQQKIIMCPLTVLIGPLNKLNFHKTALPLCDDETIDN